MSVRANRLSAARDAVGARMADEALAAYIEWREECEAVRGAYLRWTRSGTARPESALAFAAYGAALDHEERAASLYAEVIGRWRRALWPEPASDGGTTRARR